SAKGLAEHF
nr:toxin peptide 4a alpha [Bombina variegata]